MNKTFKKILSVCCTVVTTLTATLFRSTEVRADNTYKIVLIGETKVGKTQLANRITGRAMDETYTPNHMATFDRMEPRNYGALAIWTLMGDIRYRSVSPIHYRNADLKLFCCTPNDLGNGRIPDLTGFYIDTEENPILLCITKAEDTPTNKETLKAQLARFRDANSNYNILPVVLVTSAKDNNYSLCKPDQYNSTNYKSISQDLANDLAALCRDLKNADTPNSSPSTPPSSKVFSQPANKNSSDTNFMEPNDNTSNDQLNASVTKTSKSVQNILQPDQINTANNKKPEIIDENTQLPDTNIEKSLTQNKVFHRMPKNTSHMGYWLGIPASLIGLMLLGGLGYYGYDRNEKKKLVIPKNQAIKKETRNKTC